jgi:O-antigen/teichoic acid export membrane protein
VLISILIALGTYGIFISWFAPVLILLVIGVFFIRRLQHGYLPIPRLDRQTINKTARFSLGNYVVDVLATMPIYVLPLLIVNVLDTASNAYFRIVYGIASILYIIPTAIGTSLFAEGSNEPRNLRHNIIRAFKFILVILIPAILVILFFGKQILFLFGKEYVDSSLKLLWILALSSIPMSIVNICAVILRIQVKIKQLILIFLGITSLILAGSYFAINYFGLIGVGFIWTATFGIVAVIIIAWWVKKSSSGDRRAI